jgi:MYXO-CTERM domain-containing protein
MICASAGALLSLVSVGRAGIITDWTFETSQPTTAGPITPEVGSGDGSGSHAGAAVYSSPVGNGSAHSYSSNTWAVGDYYQFHTSTLGNSNPLYFQWDQTSSNTGPRDFELDISLDNSTYAPLTSYSVLANASPNAWSSGTPVPAATMSAALPGAYSNAADVYFRLKQTSTTSANGGTVATAGTDRVDNVQVTDTALPEPASLGLLGVASLFALRRRRA